VAFRPSATSLEGGPVQRLSDAFEFQAQALVLRAERQRLIASNIANADTPGYVARDMDFARALHEATAAMAPGGGGAGRTLGGPGAGTAPGGAVAGTGPGGAAFAAAASLTAPGHLPLGGGARDEAGLLYASHAQDSVDRNTVDLDRERNAFADNAVKYEATLRFINGHVRTMLDAMRSPNQG
jgi:flagellar basal-body rod protein FlgB